MTEEQSILRACHADIEQPPLLVGGVGVELVPIERQQSVLESDDEDDGELEALGGVERQELDGGGAGIAEIGVAREGDQVEESHAIVRAGLRDLQQSLQRLLLRGGIDRVAR